MTERSRPFHLAAFLGLSAGAYAVGLAAVTALQAQSEAAILRERAPTAQAIDEIATGHDVLEATADRATATYGHAARSYDAVGRTLTDLEDQLAALAGTVGTIEGAAQGLPARVALPRVTRTFVQASRPVVHATTAASGG